MRPISAAFKTPSYKLAQFVLPAFNDLIQNDFTLKNSYDFKHFMDNSTFPNNVFLASFDITSLFTNVSIKETIEIASNCVYENNNSYKGMTGGEGAGELDELVNWRRSVVPLRRGSSVAVVDPSVGGEGSKTEDLRCTPGRGGEWEREQEEAVERLRR